MTDLDTFESLIGRLFVKPHILREALTHRSFINESDEALPHNERFEFLGDAILDFIAGEMLFQQYPEMPEGELTQLRSALVRADSLAMMAKDIRLGEFLVMGKGEEATGGRTRMSILADGFEAILGAIYLDGGLQAIKDFLLPRLQTLLAYVLEHQLHIDARSLLQERSQAELHYTPKYRLVEESGKEHEREYHLEALIGDVVIGSGKGNSKRNAAQAAARHALQQLQDNGGWHPEAEAIAKAEYAIFLANKQKPEQPPSDTPPSESLSPQTPNDGHLIDSP
jgi:ribonuclease III